MEFLISICTELINAINPSTNNSANYIKKIPFIAPCEDVKRTVDFLVKRIISDIKSGVPVVDTYKKELDNIFTNLYFKGIEIDGKK